MNVSMQSLGCNAIVATLFCFFAEERVEWMDEVDVEVDVNVDVDVDLGIWPRRMPKGVLKSK